MASGSRERTDEDLRAAAARGEPTPISAIGWLRIIVRALAMVGVLLVLLPLHYLYRALA